MPRLIHGSVAVWGQCRLAAGREPRAGAFARRSPQAHRTGGLATATQRLRIAALQTARCSKFQSWRKDLRGLAPTCALRLTRGACSASAWASQRLGRPAGLAGCARRKEGAMTNKRVVIPGLDPGIQRHRSPRQPRTGRDPARRAAPWIPGSSPGMTSERRGAVTNKHPLTPLCNGLSCQGGAGG